MLSQDWRPVLRILLTEGDGEGIAHPVRIGLLADTHGFLDPHLPELMAGCNIVLHAGDVGGPGVLEGLSQLAPVRAVRGNNDVDAFGTSLPETVREPLGDLSALVVHELWAPGRLSPLARRALRRPVPIVVFGHSHRWAAALEEGTLYLNPGSAGPKRFHLPRSAGLLEIRGRRVSLRIHDLEHPGLPLLAEPLHLAL
jgi:putative phosphoesterase